MSATDPTEDDAGATASGSSPNPAREESGTFECNICLDTAKDPVISMCGHLFWFVYISLAYDHDVFRLIILLLGFKKFWFERFAFKILKLYNKTSKEIYHWVNHWTIGHYNPSYEVPCYRMSFDQKVVLKFCKVLVTKGSKSDVWTLKSSSSGLRFG